MIDINPDQRALFRALLSHPLKLRLAKAVSEGELRAEQIVRLCDRSRSTATAHLRELRKAGLIRTRRCGRTVFYHCASEEIRSWIDSFQPDALDRQPV